MHPEDVPDLVREELHGEDWSLDDLEQALQTLYDNGGGTFDPASIVRGSTEFTTRDDEYGSANQQASVARPYSDFFPQVSRKTSHGIIGEFLEEVERTDKTAARAHVMLRAEGFGHTDLPHIEEDSEDDLTGHGPDCGPIYVGAPPARGQRRKGKRRPSAANYYPAADFMLSIADSGRTRRARAKRGSGKSNSTFDLVLINSSGKPQVSQPSKSASRPQLW